MRPYVNVNCFIGKWIQENEEKGYPCIVCFHNIAKMESPKKHMLRVRQFYVPQRNENDQKKNLEKLKND